MFCGFLSNHIDIAPSYAGTLMALTNTAATLPGIIVPIFVGGITHGNVSMQATTINPDYITTQMLRSLYFQIANNRCVEGNFLCYHRIIHH